MKNTIKTIAVAALALVGIQSAASAISDFYVAGTGSATWNRDVSYKDTIPGGTTEKFDAHTGYGASLAIGYIMEEFRFELEASKRSSNLKTESTAPKQTLSNTALMVNAFYDIPVVDQISVYVGGGIGISRAMVKTRDNLNFGNSHETSYDNVFAWQLMTGVAYALNEHWTLTAGYRFFATTKPTLGINGGRFEAKKFPFSNNVELGVRYRF